MIPFIIGFVKQGFYLPSLFIYVIFSFTASHENQSWRQVKALDVITMLMTLV